MPQTPRFGLEYGGLEVLEEVKFTRGDRLLLDRLLAALEQHDHGGGSQLSDPSAAPTLTLDTAGGQLPASTTFYYVVTYLDQFGLETARSDEQSVTTAAQVAIPQGPGLTTSAGGSLASGLYQYALTAQKGSGETPLSTIATVTVSDLNTVTVSIPGGVPANADTISIWRQGQTESWFTRIATQADATPFVDDGSVAASALACLPENQPPLENTTEATSRVTIDTPAGDLTDPTLASRWRVYRTRTAGVYSERSLLAEISDTTTDGGTQLVEEYIDDGSVTPGFGSPPAASQTLMPSQSVAGGGSAGGARAPLLRDSSDGLWRITADREGRLQTSAASGLSGLPASSLAELGFELTDAGATSWRVTIGTDGVLTTAQGAALSGEATYGYGGGPDVPTYDGAVAYRLSITGDGELVTLGSADQIVAIEGVGVRRIILSPTAPTNPLDGDVWLDSSGL